MGIVSTINFDEKKKRKKNLARRENSYMLNWNSSSVENLHSPAWKGEERGRRFQRLGAELSELKI